MSLTWRQAYVISIVLRFFFGLSDSYIHPDEHFQSFEVIAAKFFNFSTTIPWEFQSDLPARSFGPLYLFYGPLFGFVKLFGIELSPKSLWYLARLQLIFVNWMVTDMCLYRLLPTKPERVKAIFFTLTSYVTLVYQSHCFSNSLETPLLLVALLIISDLRFDQEVREVKKADYEKLFYFGLVTAIGVFNRVTFPAFLIGPAFYLLKYLWKMKLGVFAAAFGFLIPVIAFIPIDTHEFGGNVPENLVITPLNNLIYNTKHENLAEHGIHPFYTHIAVNLPQIFGPLLFVLFYKGKNSYYKTVPFVSFISGIIILSLVPHQELRFLIPLVPVACCCLDFNKIHGLETENEEIKQKIVSSERNLKPEKVLSKKSNLANIIIGLWYAFNLLMCVLMGLFHQGGVVPALHYTYTDIIPQKVVEIWWRTYSPPTWLLGSQTAETITIDAFDTNFLSADQVIIDAMGADQDILYKLIGQLKTTDYEVLVVAPKASMNCDFKMESQVIWEYFYHLDLDHLNLERKECMVPGIGIYKV